MTLKKLIKTMAAGLLGLGFAAAPATAQAVFTPEQAMVDLASDIHDYARARNPDFQLLGNGAIGLLEVTTDESEKSVEKLLSSLDGFLGESIFYMEKDGKTVPQSPEVLTYLDAMLAKPKSRGLPVWTLDYVTGRKAAIDRNKGTIRSYISMTSATTGLDEIPPEVPHENKKDIQKLKDAENFLILNNPMKFENKKAYLSALAASPFDVVIIDPDYGGSPLTADDISPLKEKPQGGQRLLLAYLSVGEAADYRSYWDSSWNDESARPAWLEKPNPAWPGAWRVRYWTKDWRNILYGNKESSLDRILSAGFDGALLDVMDGWMTFK